MPDTSLFQDDDVTDYRDMIEEQKDKDDNLKYDIEDYLNDMEEFIEPEEGDYTSSDYCKWYQFGKLAVTVSIDDDHKQALRAHMDKESYWPNVWIISDHGNAHLITLED